jgi:hypothetical protein
MKDFNDSPVGRIAGSRFGQNLMAHAAEQGVKSLAGGAAGVAHQTLGTGGDPMETVNIGSPEQA